MRENEEPGMAVDRDQLRLCAERLPVMICLFGANGEIEHLNTRWLRYVGQERAEDLGAVWLSSLHPDDVREALTIHARAFDNRQAFTIGYRMRRRDGLYRRVLSCGQPHHRPDGSFGGFVSACMDAEDVEALAPDRKAAVDEINHRVKNALFSVQALARQTLWGSAELERAYDRFTSRLETMAQAHDLLLDEDWRGPSMRSLVGRVAEPFGGEGDAIELRGKDLRLAPQMSLALALCLHELFANAEKQGALAAEGGKVVVEWAAVGKRPAPRLQVRWREIGGDPAAFPNELRELGSALIQVLGPGHRADEDDETGPGVTCVLDFPLPDPGGR